MSSAASWSALIVCSFAIVAPALAIDAPVATEATSPAADGFTANWQAVAGATGYELDVFSVGEPTPTTVTEGFDDLATALPAGWTVSGTYEPITSTGNFGDTAPALKLSTDGAYVQTPAAPSAITTVSFFVKGGSSGESILYVMGLPDGDDAWEELAAIDPIPTSKPAGLNRSVSIPEAKNIRSIRFEFERDRGTVYLDDIAVVFDAEELTPVATGIDAGNSLSYAVTYLAAPATYRYVVRATDGTDVSADSNAIDVEVTGLPPDIVGPESAPVIFPATNVGDSGFTVNWSMVEGVDGYSVNISKFVSTPAVRAVEGFGGYGGNAGTVPEGWTLSEYGNYTTTTSSGATGPNSIKFTSDGATIVSPFYDDAITNVSFWAKAMSGAGPDTSATLEVRNSPDNGWVLVATNAVGTSGHAFSHDIERVWDMRQFRIIYNKDGANAAFDDFAVAYGGDYTEPVIAWESVAGAANTNYVATGLEAGDYEVVVHAVQNGLTSEDSDVIVVRVGVIAPSAPVAFEATGVSATGFTANWSEVEGATGYELDVSRIIRSAAVRGTEGFDGYEGGSTGAPEGWNLSGGTAEAATSSGYYVTTPGVRLNDDGMYVETCEYPDAVTNLSFMTKGSAATSTFTVTGESASGVWSVIADSEALSSAKITHSYDIDRALDIRRFRIAFNRVGGYMAIDDVSAAYGGNHALPVLSAQEIQGGSVTNYAVTGLTDGDYEYEVRAVNSAGESPDSNAVEVRVGDPPHAPPVIEPIAPQTVRVGGELTVALVIAQENGDEIFATNYTASASVQGECGWTSEGLFYYRPAEGDIGARSFTFTAESAGGVSTAVTMDVTVRHPVVAAIPFSTAGRSYGQNFDALEAAAAEWDDGAWPLPAWRALVGSAAPALYRASGTSSGLYSMPLGEEGRMFGSIAGGGHAIHYGVVFTNDTSDAVRQVTVAFDAAQFRAGNGNENVNTLSFSWRVANADNAGLADSAGTWNSVAALSYDTVATASDHARLNEKARLAATFPAKVLPGQVLVLRWSDADDAGTDHGMGIDDLGVSWSFSAGSVLYLR